jgi:hypothetical protein
MNSVSPLSLGKKIIEALGLTNGDTFDLSKLRDGSILLRKATAQKVLSNS